MSEAMRQFSEYANGASASGRLVEELDAAVQAARQNPRWKKEYMDLQDYVRRATQEEREEAQAELERERKRANALEEEVKHLKSQLALLQEHIAKQ